MSEFIPFIVGLVIGETINLCIKRSFFEVLDETIERPGKSGEYYYNRYMANAFFCFKFCRKEVSKSETC